MTDPSRSSHALRNSGQPGSNGFPRPLGASRLPDGRWNFAVFSQGATGMDLCLFDPDGRGTARKLMLGRTGSVWHTAVSGLKPGQHYGFRAHGPWKPHSGHYFSPQKLLIDPYARALSAESHHHPSQCHESELANEGNSAAHVAKSVLVDESFDWGQDARPAIPMTRTVIYEAHVKGMTMQHPGVPEHLRGTYAGLASDAMISHLRNLGVTSIQLLPVHQRLNDGFLIDRDLTNYWGYQTIGFFAPDARFSSRDTSRGEQVREFKEMVKRLHEEGFEVILDVVYNHTGEASPTGPTMAFRGLDSFSYYRHTKEDPGVYQDFTGCGNTVDLRHPYVIQLVLDSLRYWVEEMHVDGFRFDLSVTLGRESPGFSQGSAFFKAIHQDPILSRVKLIAEPWDLGPGGYQVGGFPEGWAELNGKYRDTMRRFWRGDHKVLPEFAWRLTGSEDLYRGTRRTPAASVNFITSHDGFCLRDLVSYHRKQNEANKENNRDGDNDNHSSNHGVEGVTDDPLILDRRDRHRRSLIASMIFSRGVPFLLGGDELGRTQGGNNNAYCQDNEISWYPWGIDAREQSFHDFVQNMLTFRRNQPALTRSNFYHGSEIVEGGPRDLVWLDRKGQEMVEASWKEDCPGQLQALVEGRLLLVFNASRDPVKFVLPEGNWSMLVDTSLEKGLHQASPGEQCSGQTEMPCICVRAYEFQAAGVAKIASNSEIGNATVRKSGTGNPPM